MVRNILKYVLRLLARLAIVRYRPGVIGVTGTVGKTSAKRAIHAVLSASRRVRAASGNFNNEIGLPLAVIGGWEKTGGALFWLKVCIVGVLQLLLKRKHYPEILILEYAVDRPGDMKYLLGIARPNIGVVTAIGDIPVHVEFFRGPEELAREKVKLLEYLPIAGFAIVNSDDEVIREHVSRTRAHRMTFGFGRDAEVAITNFETRSEGGVPKGVSFKLEHMRRTVPVKIDGAFGRTVGYAAAAGACVGLIFGMNLVTIAEALSAYRPPRGRMELVPGVKETFIIDDAYNASPLSLHAALETLKALPAKRRIAVLGDMLELGRYSMQAHEEIGKIAAGIVNVLVTVGPRAKFIAEGAKAKGMPKRSIMSFDLADEARIPVQDVIRKGDVVLVKGSRAMKMEKIVEEIRQVIARPSRSAPIV